MSRRNVEDEISDYEWEQGARLDDPEPYYARPDWVSGDHLGYEPDLFWPRDLAPGVNE